MASPFRESGLVTCVGCGDGVQRDKTDVTERGPLCERCIEQAATERARELAPKLEHESMRSTKAVDRLLDGATEVLVDIFYVSDEE